MYRFYFKIITAMVISIILMMPLFAKKKSETIGNPTAFYMMSASISANAAKANDDNILDAKRIRIINLGPMINWQGVDYAPTVSADGKTLFFVSDKPGSRLTKDGDNSHDFWAGKKADRLDTVFLNIYNIDTLTGLSYDNVNTKFHEGASSIAADKQTLFFTACDRPGGLGSCDIYMSQIDGDKWSQPVNLGKNINSENWDSQPSIAPDKSRLYFVSTRKGPNSNGTPIEKNMDIWYSDYDFDNDEWKPAQNLEELNTSKSEQTPFIGADGVTLFFASNGHSPSIGGMDFYVTRFDSDRKSWGKPDLLPEPLNTKEDEKFITLPASGDIIYFSSTRKDIPGYQGSLDVFMAFVPSFFKAVNVITTVVDECTGDFIPATITIKSPLINRIVKDSVTLSKREQEFIVSNKDYGNPKDSVKFITLDITAENPKYGSKTVQQKVDHPGITKDSLETQTLAEIRVKITLGERPILRAEMEEAEFITEAKKSQPKFANFRGLVMNEVKTWDLYALLNYVFFDEGVGTIPTRYNLFKSADQTKIFTDTTIRGGTLDKYYHLLNIYGYRLKLNPTVKIEIVGTNDNVTAKEKNNNNLSKERATNVYNYFKDIWGISTDRMKLSFRGKPEKAADTQQDPLLAHEENRRVEILCSDWNVVKPVFDRGSIIRPQPEEMTFVMKNGIEDAIVAKRRIEVKRGNQTWITHTKIGITDPKLEWEWMNPSNEFPKDEVPYTAQLIITTFSGAECASDPITIPVLQISSERKKIDKYADSTLEKYSLILFPFNSADAGPLNQKIMSDYVYERCKPSSVIEVIGHTDTKGMYDSNKKLSDKRSGTVRDGITKQTKGSYGILNSRGVGEEEPLYTNDLPEGRLYNRTVQVIVKTPLSEYEGK